MSKSTTKNKSKKRSNGKAKRTLAQKADRFDCYQKSVQDAAHEVDFFEKVYRAEFDKKPLSLREDFCGTFAVCCEWVKSHKKRTAVGIDLCSETLDWGRKNNLKPLSSKEKSRVTLLQQDVRKRDRAKVDILAAQNFSFWIFKTRPELLEYFRAAYANLKNDGIMVMDMMGGGDCFLEDNTDKRDVENGKRTFQYRWTQVSYNPVTADAKFEISFKFKDGSKLKKAFEYDWRFWSIPEVRELLLEAGFSDCYTYWECENEDGEPTGDWQRQSVVPSNACWISYLVAVR